MGASPTDVQARMISCLERTEVRARTIAGLEETDWPGSVRVHLDRAVAERREDRQAHTALDALVEAVEDGPELTLLLEDDLEFNRHLGHNIASWKPVRDREPDAPFFASLYDPTIRRLDGQEGEAFFVADPDAVYGSQAFLFSRATAAYMVEHWHEVEGMQDIKMSRLASRLGPIHYHDPSLVQHVGVVSSWGGPYHAASNFDPAWRA